MKTGAFKSPVTEETIMLQNLQNFCQKNKQTLTQNRRAAGTPRFQEIAKLTRRKQSNFYQTF